MAATRQPNLFLSRPWGARLAVAFPIFCAAMHSEDCASRGKASMMEDHARRLRNVTRHAEHDMPNPIEKSIGKGEKPYDYSAEYDKAKYRNFHKITERHLNFWKHLTTDKEARKSVILALVIACVGPFLLTAAIWYSLMALSADCRKHSRVFDVALYSTQGLTFVLSFCLTSDLAIRCIDFQEHRWIQLDFEAFVSKATVFILGLCVVRMLTTCHHFIERYLLEKENEDSAKRREFMTMITHPTDIEPISEVGTGQEEVIYHKIWIPFYLITVCAIWLVTAFIILNVQAELYILMCSYVAFLLFGSVFGGQTVGQDLYGGLVLLTEKPFQVGDIVSIESKAGAGGCKDSLVTGFVERISIRSTIIRRFDMRACTVPNCMMSRSMLSNWDRPRKLISIDLSVSHRSPVEAVRRFSEEALKITKNHKDVDQTLYTKAVFRKLENGYNFRVVCYNTHGTKKQFVQQDLIYRLSELARKLDIAITFGEQSIEVWKNDCAAHFDMLRNADALSNVDLAGVVPPEKIKVPLLKSAPKNFLLIRLETATGLEGLLPEGVNPQRLEFFTRVMQGAKEPTHHKSRTGKGVMHSETKDVRFYDSYDFKFPSNGKVPCAAQVQIFAVSSAAWHGGRSEPSSETTQHKAGQVVLKEPRLLAEATISLPDLAKANSAPTPTLLSQPGESASGTAKIGVRVFLGEGLRFVETNDDEEGHEDCEDDDELDEHGNAVVIPHFLRRQTDFGFALKQAVTPGKPPDFC